MISAAAIFNIELKVRNTPVEGQLTGQEQHGHQHAIVMVGDTSGVQLNPAGRLQVFTDFFNNSNKAQFAPCLPRNSIVGNIDKVFKIENVQKGGQSVDFLVIVLGDIGMVSGVKRIAQSGRNNNKTFEEILFEIGSEIKKVYDSVPDTRDDRFTIGSLRAPPPENKKYFQRQCQIVKTIILYRGNRPPYNYGIIKFDERGQHSDFDHQLPPSRVPIPPGRQMPQPRAQVFPPNLGVQYRAENYFIERNPDPHPSFVYTWGYRREHVLELEISKALDYQQLYDIEELETMLGDAFTTLSRMRFCNGITSSQFFGYVILLGDRIFLPVGVSNEQPPDDDAGGDMAPTTSAQGRAPGGGRILPTMSGIFSRFNPIRKKHL